MDSSTWTRQGPRAQSEFDFAEERVNIVDNEFDLGKNAIYTDLEDQSAWFYELWLIGRGVSLLLKGLDDT
jgi:hypothetical protein